MTIPGVDLAALQAEANRLSNSTNKESGFSNNFLKLPEEGALAIRLLPPVPLEKYGHKVPILFQPTKLSYLNGKGVHCNVELVNGKWEGDCPIVGFYHYLWNQTRTDPARKDHYISQARKIKPIDRFYYNVIVRDQEDEGVKILSVGKTIHEMIMKAFVGDPTTKMKPLGDITDFKNGRDFILVKKIRRSDGQEFPNYSESRFDDPAPAGTPEQCAKWISEAHDLAALRQIKPIEELKLELKKHLGLISNTAAAASSSWNPSEFQTPVAATAAATSSVSTVETVATSTAPELAGTTATQSVAQTTPAASEVVERAPVEDEALPEDDFMATLNALAQKS